MNSPKQPIYVVVNVSFDYYRFQENVGAALDLDSARKIAEEFRKKPRLVGATIHFPNLHLPIIEDRELSVGDYWEREAPHLFIEKHDPA